MKKIFSTLFLLLSVISCKAENNGDTTKLFTEEEVFFFNGSNMLSGTLTIPAGKPGCPAVLLVTGSGLQNRDEDIFGFKLFKIIAEELSGNGIAVLRYDDRGFGKSKGDVKTATTRDFAMDAAAGIKYLRTRDEINKNKVGILGHSEGGIIAAMLAAEPAGAPDFCIMMAGPAVPGDTIINFQIISMNKAQGVDEKEIPWIIDFQNKVYDYIRNYDLASDSTALAALESELLEFNLKAIDLLPDSIKKNVTDRQKFAKFRVMQSIGQLTNPWFKYFITYNPAEALRKVNVPILALFGGKDMQVPPDMNVPALKEAIGTSGNKDAEIKIFPDANHLFQKANTGQATEYPTLKKEFCEGFLDYITQWIIDRAK